jgi:hypothetical protein
VTLVERARSWRALRSKICVMARWHHIHRHARTLQHCMQLCRATNSSHALLRRCLLVWTHEGENCRYTIMYNHVIRLAQKRMLSRTLLSWKEASPNLESSCGRFTQNTVVEAVRKNLLRLATRCFWSWVAFLHFRQKTMQSFFVVNGVQDKSLLGRSFFLWVAYRGQDKRIHAIEDKIRYSRYAIYRNSRCSLKTFELWVKRVRRRRRDMIVLHNVVHRKRRMILHYRVSAWQKFVEVQKGLLRREEIFLRRWVGVNVARFVLKWRKAHARTQRRATNAARIAKRTLRRICMAFFSSWLEVSCSHKRLHVIAEVLLVRRKRTLQVTMLHAWQNVIKMPGMICVSTATSPSTVNRESSPGLRMLQEKLREQEEQIAELETHLQFERNARREEVELQRQKMVLELEQALEHATRATHLKASPGIRRGAARSTPTRTAVQNISPLMGASPLQIHVLSMVSGSNNSLFVTPPSSPAKAQKIKWVNLKRNFNAWKVMALPFRQRRLLVAQAIMCCRRAGEQMILNHAFSMWLILLRQAIKVSNVGDALNFQYRRLMVVNCFYAWVLRRTDSKEQHPSSPDTKEELEWQVLPSPQKMSPQQEPLLDASEVVRVHALELQKSREQIANLNLRLEEELESRARASTLMQEQVSAKQNEVQMLLSQLDQMEHRSSFVIYDSADAASQGAGSSDGLVPPSECSCILPVSTRTMALTLWSWRSGVDHVKMLDVQATIAGTRRRRLITKLSFARWLERASRTTRILITGKAMHRRRKLSLIRKCILQMVQHVRNNLRSRLVHTPVGAMLEHATKESREQHFIKNERRVNVQFERSLYIWSVAVWKGCVRVSKKHRQEREAANRKHLHSTLRRLKQKFRCWVAMSTFKRSLVRRMKTRIERQCVHAKRSSFEAWVMVARSLRRISFREATVLRSSRLHLIRRVFAFFVLHTEILNSMRCSLLRIRFHQSRKRLSTAYRSWTSMVAAQRNSNMRAALLLSRRKLGWKTRSLWALRSGAEIQKNARERSRAASYTGLKCCTRKRATRTFKAWSSYVKHRRMRVMESLHLSSAFSQRPSEPKVSLYFSTWREIGERKSVQLQATQLRARRRKLHQAFSALHGAKYKQRHLQRLLQICLRPMQFKIALVFDALRSRCAAKHWQKHLQRVFQRRSDQRMHVKVAGFFREWRNVLHQGLMIRKYSLRSQSSFEQRLFVRCARYWFASHVHHKNNRERISCLLVSTEQDCTSKALREWSIATQRQRRVRSLIDMKRFYPVALASAGIFWWRQVCMRERTRRTFDGIFASFHRRYSLHGALALWNCVARHARSKMSACRVVDRKNLQLKAKTKGMALRCLKMGSTAQKRKKFTILRVIHRAKMILGSRVLTSWARVQRSMSTVRALVARLNAKQARRLLTRVFEYLLPSQPCASLVRLPRFGYQRLNKLSHFLTWSFWTVDQLEAAKAHRHNRNQAYRRATHMLASRAFKQWSMLTSAMHGTLLKLRRFVCKWIRVRLSFYLSRWCDDVCFGKCLLGKATRRNRCSEKCKAWITWWSITKDRKKQRRIFRTAITRMRHYVTHRSFMTWKSNFKARVRQRSTFQAKYLRKSFGAVRKALLNWGTLTMLRRRRRKILEIVLCRLQDALVYKVWVQWAAGAKQTNRHCTITLKMVSRKKNAMLFRVWVSLKHIFNELRRRQGAENRLARKTQRANLCKAWEAWMPLCSRFSASECKMHHLMRCSNHSCTRRQFRHWALILMHTKTEKTQQTIDQLRKLVLSKTNEKTQQTIDHLRKLVLSVQSRRKIRAIFEEWLASLETSLGLLRAAQAVSTKSRVHLAAKYFNMWMSTRVHNQQQKTRISQESMIVQIRCLSNRRLEHLAARTLRLKLRQHLCAWRESNALLRAVSSRHRFAMMGSIGQFMQEWTNFVDRRSIVQQKMAHITCALLAARRQQNAIWLEILTRGHRASAMVVMRVNSIHKKTAFDRWHFKCLLATATPGVQRREKARRKRGAFVRWCNHTSYCANLGRKLSQFIHHRKECRIVGSFAMWTLLKRVTRRRARAEPFRMRKLLASVVSDWRRCLDMLQRTLFCQRVCTVQARCSQKKLLVKFVQIWQQMVQLSKFEDGVSSQLIAEQRKIKQLQHLSCAQLYMSTVQGCEMRRGRQQGAFRALAEYVNHKRMHRRTRRLMLTSTAARRQGRLMHSVWRAWFKHVVNTRLQTIERHMQTYLCLAATVESQRHSQEQGLEEMISSVRCKFANWETELLETQTLLHATCETFLESYDQTASPVVKECTDRSKSIPTQGLLGWSVTPMVSMFAQCERIGEEDKALAPRRQASDDELSLCEIYGEHSFPLQTGSEPRPVSPFTST